MFVDFIYVAQIKPFDENWRNFYKIGTSSHPDWRIKELGIQNATVSLWDALPCSPYHRNRLEKTIHSRFKDYWVQPYTIREMFNPVSGSTECFYFKEKACFWTFYGYWKHDFKTKTQESFSLLVYESLHQSTNDALSTIIDN